MTGYEVFRYYLTIKTHFGGTYDYFKYRGLMKNVSEISYERRLDKAFFDAIARKVSQENIMMFFVANFVHNKSMYIGEYYVNFEKAKSVFLAWKKLASNLYFTYCNDLRNIVDFAIRNEITGQELFKVKDSDHPLIFRFLLSDMICIETFVILENIIKFCASIDAKLKDEIIWKQEYKIVSNYTPFMVYDYERFYKQTKQEFKRIKYEK